jgi:riboflavin biosynthesis pyrimidine reductase
MKPSHIEEGFDLTSFEASYVNVDRAGLNGRPWLMTNFVVTPDGSAASDGRVGMLTEPLDQHLFGLLRSLADVILVGAGTVRAEGYGPHNPNSHQRNARAERGQPPTAPLAVVTASGQLPPDSALFAAPEQTTQVITSASAAERTRDRLGSSAEVLVVGDEEVDLGQTVRQLGDRGARVVLCEGGPALLGGLLSLGLVDEMCLTVSPMLLGDHVRMLPAGALPAPVDLVLASWQEYRSHLFLRYVMNRPAGGGL